MNEMKRYVQILQWIRRNHFPLTLLVPFLIGFLVFFIISIVSCVH